MSYEHVTGQVCARLLQASMNGWHLHHRRQQQHNLASRHACVHLARTALRAWWRELQQPTHGNGFDFELLTKPTAPGFAITFGGGRFVSDRAKNRSETVSDLAQTRSETRAGDNL